MSNDPKYTAYRHRYTSTVPVSAATYLYDVLSKQCEKYLSDKELTMAMNTKLMKQVHASAQARAAETKRLYDEGFIDHDQATRQMKNHQQQAKMESVHARKDGVALAREAFNAQMATKGSDRGPVSKNSRTGWWTHLSSSVRTCASIYHLDV